MQPPVNTVLIPSERHVDNSGGFSVDDAGGFYLVSHRSLQSRSLQARLISTVGSSSTPLGASTSGRGFLLNPADSELRQQLTHRLPVVSPVRIRPCVAGTRKTTHRWTAKINRQCRSCDRHTAKAVELMSGAGLQNDRDRKRLQRHQTTLETTRIPHDGREITTGLPLS